MPEVLTPDTGSADPATDQVVSIIVPTRNEARNIAPLLARLTAALRDEPTEIIFVDDSTDDTPEVISREAAALGGQIRLIARPESERNGLSGAVVRGMAEARGYWVCVLDADLQHPPEIIPHLLSQARRTGADIVVASREADVLGPRGLSRARALTSQALTILARTVFPKVLKNVSDPLTGFFLVRRDAIDTDILQPQGFKILLEILARHPDLRVTELHFPFAERHEGQSKADLNEGLRFFRHLTRLRLTVNQHLSRFLALIAMVVAVNLIVLTLMVRGAGQPLLLSAAVAGIATIVLLLFGEMWVFSDRPRGDTRRRLMMVVLLSVIFVIAIYLPLIWLLAVRLGLPYLAAALGALLAAGFVYYLFSEQWIWTRGLMMRPRESEYYDIHGILKVASQIPLADLAYFRVDSLSGDHDLLIRVDRHGTPSRVSGAICYDEHLGRFGFGLTVIPGEYTEIVVSPLLETSPAFVFVNVVEPVLRWQLLARGYALAKAAAVRLPGAGPAVLVAGGTDLSEGLGRLGLRYSMEFMGDDAVIVERTGMAYCYPKPVTANRDMLRGQRARRTALSYRLRRLLYSRPIRALGLFFSRRQLPAATANTYLQRLIPQPKFQMADLLPEIAYAEKAAVEAIVILLKEGETGPVSDVDEAVALLSRRDFPYSGFQPYPLLVEQLASWDGKDWAAEERALLRALVIAPGVVRRHTTASDWWEVVAQLETERGNSHPLPGPMSLIAETARV